MRVKTTIDTSGLDRFLKKLKEIEKPEKVGFDVLFPDTFIQRYTDYDSADAFWREAGVTTTDDESVAAARIQSDEFSQFVGEHTRFAGWSDMLRKASEEHLARKIRP